MIEYLVYIIKHSRALANSVNSGVIMLYSVNEKLAQCSWYNYNLFHPYTFFSQFFFFSTHSEGCKSLQVYLYVYHLFIAKFCFILIDFLLLSTHTFIIKFSWGIDRFNIMKYSSLLLVNHPCLENFNCLIHFFIYIFLYFSYSFPFIFLFFHLNISFAYST